MPLDISGPQGLQDIVSMTKDWKYNWKGRQRADDVEIRKPAPPDPIKKLIEQADYYEQLSMYERDTNDFLIDSFKRAREVGLSSPSLQDYHSKLSTTFKAQQ